MKTDSNIIAFGDSIMKGIVIDNATIDDSVKYCVCTDNFITKCGNFFGKTIDNLSRFGSTIIQGLKYFERFKKVVKPGDYVLMEFGGNDSNFDWKAISDDYSAEHIPMTPISCFNDTYCSMIDQVRDIDGIPILLTLPPIQPKWFFEYVSKGLNANNILKWLSGTVESIANWHEQYNLEVFKIGIKKKVSVIDITSAFLNKKNFDLYFCADGMHPNELGQALIAETIINEMNYSSLAI